MCTEVGDVMIKVTQCLFGAGPVKMTMGGGLEVFFNPPIPQHLISDDPPLPMTFKFR